MLNVWHQRLQEHSAAGLEPLTNTHAGLAPVAADAFAALYNELLPPVFGYIRFRVGDLHVAEDLTAQVFERGLRRLASVREPERVRAWLFMIARHAIADYYRTNRPTVPLETADNLEHLWVDSPEVLTERRDDVHRVLAQVAVLSDRERELVGLKFAGCLCNREIARVTGLAEANVAQILHRALVRLRQRFEEETRP